MKKVLPLLLILVVTVANGQSFILKALALINFIVLVSLFVLYKGDALPYPFSVDNHNQLTSPNGGTPANVHTDTTGRRTDSLLLQRFQPRIGFMPRTEVQIRMDPPKPVKDTAQLRSLWMHSSKTGVVFDQRRIAAHSRVMDKDNKKTKQRKHK